MSRTDACENSPGGACSAGSPWIDRILASSWLIGTEAPPESVWASCDGSERFGGVEPGIGPVSGSSPSRALSARRCMPCGAAAAPCVVLCCRRPPFENVWHMAERARPTKGLPNPARALSTRAFAACNAAIRASRWLSWPNRWQQPRQRQRPRRPPRKPVPLPLLRWFRVPVGHSSRRQSMSTSTCVKPC